MRLLCLLSSLAAASAAAAPQVPKAQIPPSVVAELRMLENQFDLALAMDCAPERCFSKGCVYGEHTVADKPRSTSLPGLGEEQGPGSVQAQEYLTLARCSFAHERTIGARDVSALVKRLEQKLSKGWTMVSVEHEVLEPISPGLRESPQPKPEAPPQTPEAPKPVQPLPPEQWEFAIALRELWVALLPHFSWMIAVLLATLAALTVIWGLRRLGKESLEEKALLAQMASAPAAPPETVAAEQPALALPAPSSNGHGNGAADDGFVLEQNRLWSARIAEAEQSAEPNGIQALVADWMRAGELALLAKAVFLFPDLPLAFPADGELAAKKLELAEYLRRVDPERLPSDAEFFKKLNQHALSSSLLAQSDADIVRALREEFGSAGLAQLVEALPPRHGALLFALSPADCQHEVARLLSPERLESVTERLLLSNRISNEERAYLFEALRAARAGEAMPQPPAAADVSDRGRPFDAAGALSVLLPHVEAETRTALFGSVLGRANGAFPGWYGEILFPDMLLKVPRELLGDLVLEVDVRSLAAWLSLQPGAWQERLVSGVAPSLAAALRVSMEFGSRDEQLALARRGRMELGSALQRLVTRGQLSFADVVV